MIKIKLIQKDSFDILTIEGEGNVSVTEGFALDAVRTLIEMYQSNRRRAELSCHKQTFVHDLGVSIHAEDYGNLEDAINIISIQFAMINYTGSGLVEDTTDIFLDTINVTYAEECFDRLGVM